MLVFVLPKLANVFNQLNVELPITTKIVLGIGTFIGGNTILFFLMIAAVVGLGFLIMSIKATRNIITNIFLSAPGIKSIVIEIDVARFSRTLSTLLTSGVPIMVSLDVASALLRQPGLRKHAKTFSPGVATGESLSGVLSRTEGVFPSTVVQTIKAGEESGSLEEVLGEMADFYEKEVDYNLKKLTSLLEPLLMLIIGLAVGGMVIVMITPIYSLVSGMGKV
jgi:type IV pilus assembly protein PilC